MKIGDKLDALTLGHAAIDVKSLLKEAGYVVPQGSVARFPEMPPIVSGEIAAIKKQQERYTTLDKHAEFECPDCKEHNGSMWRMDMADGTVFLACGACHRVVEVR